MKKTLLYLCLLMIIMLSFSVSVYAQIGPGGACCYDNNTKCENVPNEPSCGDAPTGDGIFHAGVTCDQNPCTTAVPTMSEWGMIFFMVLAGGGAVYFMRRQKNA
jgi:hypothetical protein